MTDGEIILAAITYIGGVLGALMFYMDRKPRGPKWTSAAGVLCWPFLLIGLAVFAVLDKLDN